MKPKEVTLAVRAISFEMNDCQILAIVDGKDVERWEFRRKLEENPANNFHPAELIIADGGSKWFAVYNEDCFFPALAVTQADNEEDAIGNVSLHCKWFAVTADLYGGEAEFEKAIEEGLVGFASTGEAYDAETLRCVEVKPVAVYF